MSISRKIKIIKNKSLLVGMLLFCFQTQAIETGENIIDEIKTSAHNKHRQQQKQKHNSKKCIPKTNKKTLGMYKLLIPNNHK